MTDLPADGPAAVTHRDVVCPFCALGCDDLAVEARGTALRVPAGAPAGCARAFEAPPGDPSPYVDGARATLEAAVDRAAAILGLARFPLVDGLAADTDGVRAALRLAEAAGGTIDHAGGRPLLANVRVMQTGGWVTATLAEVRARADLLVLFGTDAASLMPRFFERVAFPRPLPEGVPGLRRVVLVGEGLNLDAARSPEGVAAEFVPCPKDRLAEAAAVLRAGVEGREVPGIDPGLPVAALRGLAASLREARYSILAWDAGELPPGDAELTVSILAELLKGLNATTRALGLPLAGPGNAVGANQVAGWSWGVPLRTSVASGAPDYDPEAFEGGRLLAAGAADARVWVSAFADRPPPAPAGVPTVALVRGDAGAVPAEVVIPVGTPGLDHAGSVFRTDSVVALPLRPLRAAPAGLPRAADVLDAIRARLVVNRGSARPC